MLRDPAHSYTRSPFPQRSLIFQAMSFAPCNSNRNVDFLAPAVPFVGWPTTSLYCGLVKCKGFPGWPPAVRFDNAEVICSQRYPV